MFEENDIFFVDCQQILFLTSLLDRAYQTVLETLFVSLKMKNSILIIITRENLLDCGNLYSVEFFRSNSYQIWIETFSDVDVMYRIGVDH